MSLEPEHLPLSLSTYLVIDLHVLIPAALAAPLGCLLPRSRVTAAARGFGAIRGCVAAILGAQLAARIAQEHLNICSCPAQPTSDHVEDAPEPAWIPEAVLPQNNHDAWAMCMM